MPWNLYDDLKFGKRNEKKVVHYLNTHGYEQDGVILYENERNQLDMRNNQFIGELKTRNCNHDAYPDTMFGYNKILFLRQLNEGRVFKFYFLFKDGLYLWDFHENEFTVRDFYHQEKGVIDQAYVNRKYLKLVDSDLKNDGHFPHETINQN
tara:strand:+ start:350 stop:802 length:453 start_codon:yes stop_codon:yes gene_type:complete